MRNIILATMLIALSCANCAAHAATLNFKWDANDPKDQVKEYRLYQDGVKVASISPPLLTASVPNVTPGSHSYYLTATNEWGEGPQGNVVTTPPTASAPTGLQMTISIEVTVK